MRTEASLHNIRMRRVYMMAKQKPFIEKFRFARNNF